LYPTQDLLLGGFQIPKNLLNFDIGKERWFRRQVLQVSHAYNDQIPCARVSVDGNVTTGLQEKRQRVTIVLNTLDSPVRDEPSKCLLHEVARHVAVSIRMA
jgi:hypothetical protein